MKGFPVYLFTGFLDGGKTTRICQMLRQGDIDGGGRPILLLQCESGLAGYPDVLQRSCRLQIHRLRTPEECTRQALMTLAEYLVDYAAPETKRLGFDLIERELEKIPKEKIRRIAAENIERIKSSDKRDFRF